jgi:SAM-dependent methyltransferase
MKPTTAVRFGSIADVMSAPHARHSHQHTEGESESRPRWLASEWSFISAALPPAPARLLEIGCGATGGIVPAALAAGYRAVGVDPQAPEGAAYRQVPFEKYEPPSGLDVVVSVQALHHLPNLDAAFERVDRMLTRHGVLVIVEWAWERIDEATARWLFAQVPAEANSGWAAERRDKWRASGLPWPEYRDRWAHEHGLHSWRAVESALADRFETVLREDAPSLFGDIAEISKEAERAAIAAGEISSIGIHWVGRRRTGARAQ